MKSFKEALKGNQHKLDKNKNGKLDSHDFKLLRKEEEQIDEVEKATGDLKDACWKGYTAVGMKKKNGKMVPNCVPEEVSITMTAEEFEQLDEISKKTLGSYISKASVDMSNRTADGAHKRALAGADYAHDISRGMSVKQADANLKKDYDDAKPDTKKAVKRMYGIDKAVGRLTKEEAEDLEEATPTKLQVKQAIGIARDRRYASGNMTGAVKTMNKINKGLADHPVVKKELQKQNEEVEELDELSKTTLGSYAKKATHDARIQQSIGKDFERHVMTSRKPEYKAASKSLEDKYKSKSRSREAGIGKAIDRLTKEAAYTNPGLEKLAAQKQKEKEKANSMKYGSKVKEEAELDEKMDIAKAKMGDVIKDFQSSDAPQFAGKSQEKRRQMALAAKLQADRQANESMSFSAYMKLEETAEIELIELEEMISYTDFQGKIDAHKKAGNRVVDSKYGNDKAHYTVVDKEGTARKVIHTARGTQMQNLGNVKGDDSDESPSGEKRGRGRPKGSKSGASGPRIK